MKNSTPSAPPEFVKYVRFSSGHRLFGITKKGSYRRVTATGVPIPRIRISKKYRVRLRRLERELNQ